MNTKALRTLEFDKIIEMLAGKAISQPGKALARELVPAAELYDIEIGQKETSEAMRYILKNGSLPLGGIRDVGASAKRAEMNGILMIEELMHVAEFLYVCGKAVNYAKEAERSVASDRIGDMFGRIVTLPHLAKELNRCILNEQELSDDASPRLSDIRKNIKTQNARVRETLNSIIHSQTYKTMLQDPVITIRNGRFCVPVRAEHKSSFQGMVHDQSGSGSTLFVEPMSVVSLNNKIKELEAEERAEIERILRKLSGLVAEDALTITTNSEVLTHLDFVFAKAELSLSMNGFEPKFNERGVINLKRARHPLLDKEKAVPIDIRLGDGFTILLITGPNTGGKTVALKTLGLFTLMGHAGLHIPAAENPELAVFDDVFADIGDEQSIEQSLSTFSGHMSNIVKILDKVTPFSLVLLDELGAGTDPTEGAALAVAIIKFLHDRKIRSAITTHYSELKVFGLQTEGIENAACEFDVESLRPTYRLLIGIPGKSNAFAISRRLGLTEDIIESARAFLTSEDERFEDVITNLEISRKTVEMEQERAERFRQEAEKLKRDYESQKAKLAESREKILKEARDEAKKATDAAKKEVDRIIKETRQIQESGRNIKELEEKRGELREMAAQFDQTATETVPPPKYKKIERPLKPGERVYIHSLSQRGVIIAEADSSGSIMVQAGIMKVKVGVNALSLDESAPAAPKNPERAYSLKGVAERKRNISPTLDIRGNTSDMAFDKIDSYLGDAYFAGLQNVTILHGKGTGALRHAVQGYLKSHPHVKKYRDGAFGEGDLGVTIVELK
ncbi:MAG: endonuclease MutS2 [Defluviitaleaceae bacterium]|nr:endonuclease MutS2 [Defluviitaleaceae bacterium]MCL2836178.1 endonuclease MutS2 [Defluviitaleaceae bacterium]